MDAVSQRSTSARKAEAPARCGVDEESLAHGKLRVESDDSGGNRTSAFVIPSCSPAEPRARNWNVSPVELSRYLERDPETLAGAARVRGTRLSVDFVLGLFEQGWSEKDVLENYPELTHDMLAAVFAFARESLRAEQIISLAS